MRILFLILCLLVTRCNAMLFVCTAVPTTGTHPGLTSNTSIYYPDGTIGYVQLAQGQSLDIPGAQWIGEGPDGANDGGYVSGYWQNSFDQHYVIVYDNTGVGWRAHQTYDFTSFYLQGFWWGLAVFSTIAFVGVVRRGLRVGSGVDHD